MVIITLLTDFGVKDPYGAIMKGVILSINPDVKTIDITHEVEAQDIREAAFIIKEYYSYFEKGTIHLAVVDPMVGSDRRPIIVMKDDYLFVGPDNGIFTLIADEGAEIYGIENRTFMAEHISNTFHGRDIFAPAAAHLSLRFHPSAFGIRVDNPVRLPNLFPRIDGETMGGIIIRFDRFGNGITNIPGKDLHRFIGEHPFSIEIGIASFSIIHRSYYEKEMTCLIGSSGYLEFGCFKGSFKDRMGALKGDEVRIRLL
jgi:hypothetical protein